MRRIKDWTLLPGASIEIRQQGSYVCSGYVDAVTDDGDILWLISPSNNRKLFEKAEFYEAWAIEDRDGFHYEVTKNQEHQKETALSFWRRDMEARPRIAVAFDIRSTA
ncbi:hypothetical protein AB0O54_20810 [Pseudarthrobacter oxydans]|uniref:hypothetical protein n=1 Tax=Pseudarthrobacter oxydans TaxID=1671 RepID=UPI0034426C8E